MVQQREHTPEPWGWRPSDETGPCEIYGILSGNVLAGVYGLIEATIGDDEIELPDEANARLMASAPELLAALIEVLPPDGLLEPRGDTFDAEAWMLKARAIVAKATGGSGMTPDDRINLTLIGLSALDERPMHLEYCNPALKVCRVCWYGPECGPFYGIERTSIDTERRCPCECHATLAVTRG